MAEPVQGSPEWWLVTLSAELDKRAAVVKTCDDYYCGHHPLPEANPGSFASAEAAAKRQWRLLALSGVTNWTALVADAPAERLEVIGFRFGEEATGDKDAWKLWQANQLDADSDLVHGTALQTGQAFALVWPSEASPVGVEITVEHPDQTIVAYQAGSRRLRVAGLKRWVDDDGFLHATVYLPDALYKYRSRVKADGMATTAPSFDAKWMPRAVEDELWPLPNPLGTVPLVEFRANPSLKPSRYGGGVSEFAKVLSIQDRINKTIFDRMVTAEHQAFRQRYVIGWDYPTLPDGTADRSAMLKAAASRMWTFTGEEGAGQVQVGELGQADFTPFVKAVESDVQAMAAISKTPPHYLLGQMVNVSGDAVTAAEAGLIAKCRRHARNFGESWEEVMRLALAATNDPRAADVMSMIQWGDMESRTWGETVDAVLKMSALGVPPEALWLKLPDTTPQDVDRWKAMQGAGVIRTTLMDDEDEPVDESVDAG